MTDTLPQRIEAAEGADDCDNHTPCPEGYIEWHQWAEFMSKTHTQRRCRECGLYAIWEPKTALRAKDQTND